MIQIERIARARQTGWQSWGVRSRKRGTHSLSPITYGLQTIAFRSPSRNTSWPYRSCSIEMRKGILRTLSRVGCAAKGPHGRSQDPLWTQTLPLISGHQGDLRNSHKQSAPWHQTACEGEDNSQWNSCSKCHQQ